MPCDQESTRKVGNELDTLFGLRDCKLMIYYIFLVIFCQTLSNKEFKKFQQSFSGEKIPSLTSTFTTAHTET